MRIDSRLFLVAAWPLFVAGCGVGYASRWQTSTIGPTRDPHTVRDPDLNDFPTYGTMKGSPRLDELVFEDKTGLLLAGAATGASASSARSTAATDAANRGASSFEYTVKGEAPMPGALTTLALFRGTAEGVDVTGVTGLKANFPKATFRVSGFDLRTGLNPLTWSFVQDHLRLALRFGAYYVTYAVQGMTNLTDPTITDVGFDGSRVGMPTSLVLGVRLHRMVTLAFEAMNDPLGYVNAMFENKEDGPRRLFIGSVGGTINVRPVSFFMLFAGATKMRGTLNYGRRDLSETSYEVGAMVLFGGGD